MKSFLQTENWAIFKEDLGWQKHDFEGIWGLSKTFQKNLTFLYFPELEYNKKSLDLIELIKTDPKFNKYIFVRFEFLEKFDETKVSGLEKLGLVKSFEEVQPEYRQWIDISKSEDDIIANMRERGRRNYTKVKEENLQVEFGRGKNMIDGLAKLCKMTGKRAGFETRNAEYFAKLLDRLGDMAEIILVKKDGQYIAGELICYFEQTASFLYGGTDTTAGSNAPILMHIEAIKRAKARGCTIYDLIAVAPPDQPKHKYAGITFFKQQFGGETVRLLGSFDLVNRAFWYKIYSVIEKRRRS